MWSAAPRSMCILRVGQAGADGRHDPNPLARPVVMLNPRAAAPFPVGRAERTAIGRRSTAIARMSEAPRNPRQTPPSFRPPTLAFTTLCVRLRDVTRRTGPQGLREGGNTVLDHAPQPTSPAARRRGTDLAPVSGLLDGQKTGDSFDDHQPVDRSWMDIPDDERQRLLQETDDYLDELIEKVGQPSAKHVESAKRLVESLQ